MKRSKLFKKVKKEVVKEAVFQMIPDKVSGPDGFTVGFFQCFWEIIGDDIFE